MPRLFHSILKGRKGLMLACLAVLCLGRLDYGSAADIAPEKIAELEVEFMGRGYDITKRYAQPDSFKAPVYEIQNGWSKPSKLRAFLSETKSGKSFRKFYSSLNMAASVQGEYGVYSGEFDVQFGSKSMKNQRSAFMSHTEHLDYVELALGRHHWADGVREEILNQEGKGLTPEQVIAKYGTHFTSKIVLGGRVSVSTTLEENAAESETNLNSHIKAAYSGLVSGEASVGSDNSSASDTVNRSANVEVYGGDPALAGKIKARKHSAEGFDAWMGSVPANPVISRIPKDGGLVPIWTLANSPDLVGRKAELRAATDAYIAKHGIKLEGGSGGPILDNASLEFKLVGTGNYMGANVGGYAKLDGAAGNYTIGGGAGRGPLKQNVFYAIKLGGDVLYETAKGNAGFYGSDTGLTARWKFLKVTSVSSPGDVLHDGDQVFIYNNYYPTNFLYDYGNGYVSAGNYPDKNHTWKISISK